MNEWCFSVNSTLQGYAGPGTTWNDKMNFGMNHAPGAGFLCQFGDLQPIQLPLCYGCPQVTTQISYNIELHTGIEAK